MILSDHLFARNISDFSNQPLSHFLQEMDRKESLDQASEEEQIDLCDAYQSASKMDIGFLVLQILSSLGMSLLVVPPFNLVFAGITSAIPIQALIEQRKQIMRSDRLQAKINFISYEIVQNEEKDTVKQSQLRIAKIFFETTLQRYNDESVNTEKFKTKIFIYSTIQVVKKLQNKKQ